MITDDASMHANDALICLIQTYQTRCQGQIIRYPNCQTVTATALKTTTTDTIT